MIERTWKHAMIRAGIILTVTAICYALACLAIHIAALGYTPLGALIIIVIVGAGIAAGYTLGWDDMRDILTHIDEEQEEGGWL